MNCNVVGLKQKENMILDISYFNEKTNEKGKLSGDYYLSTMPVKDLIGYMEGNVPETVMQVADGLKYRDFITVGLLVKKLKVRNDTKILTLNNIIPDNWIYVQERDVRVGRLQIFNNWSPYMVSDPDKVWIGLEYFCYEGDDLWSMEDEDFKEFAINELNKIGIIDREDVEDSTILRMQKAYPAYFNTYSQFDVVRQFTDEIENLFLVGRNGMHKYNNSDHSMLTAIAAVENIITGKKTRENIWGINTEDEYHEKK